MVTRNEKQPFFVAVHVGAGYHSEKNEPAYRRAMSEACLAAAAVLRKADGTSLDAVEAAIKVLEDSPVTNAGIGSNLTACGRVECDASIMDGDGRTFAAVGALPGIKNPISAAALLARQSRMGLLPLGRIRPIFLVGEGARDWALENGLEAAQDPQGLVTASAFKRWQKYAALLSREETVRRRSEGAKQPLVAMNCDDVEPPRSFGGELAVHVDSPQFSCDNLDVQGVKVRGLDGQRDHHMAVDHVEGEMDGKGVAASGAPIHLDSKGVQLGLKGGWADSDGSRSRTLSMKERSCLERKESREGQVAVVEGSHCQLSMNECQVVDGLRWQDGQLDGGPESERRLGISEGGRTEVCQVDGGHSKDCHMDCNEGGHVGGQVGEEGHMGVRGEKDCPLDPVGVVGGEGECLFKRERQQLDGAYSVECQLDTLEAVFPQRECLLESDEDQLDGTDQEDCQLDTVGAVCVDAEGKVAAGVSSGGIAMKVRGRVGEAAAFGCGCWAQNVVGERIPAAGCSSTGVGETIIRGMLARMCCSAIASFLEEGPSSACEHTLQEQLKRMATEYDNPNSGLREGDMPRELGILAVCADVAPATPALAAVGDNTAANDTSNRTTEMPTSDLGFPLRENTSGPGVQAKLHDGEGDHREVVLCQDTRKLGGKQGGHQVARDEALTCGGIGEGEEAALRRQVAERQPQGGSEPGYCQVADEEMLAGGALPVREGRPRLVAVEMVASHSATSFGVGHMGSSMAAPKTIIIRNRGRVGGSSDLCTYGLHVRDL